MFSRTKLGVQNILNLMTNNFGSVMHSKIQKKIC